MSTRPLAQWTKNRYLGYPKVEGFIFELDCGCQRNVCTDFMCVHSVGMMVVRQTVSRGNDG